MSLERMAGESVTMIQSAYMQSGFSVIHPDIGAWFFFQPIHVLRFRLINRSNQSHALLNNLIHQGFSLQEQREYADVLTVSLHSVMIKKREPA